MTMNRLPRNHFVRSQGTGRGPFALATRERRTQVRFSSTVEGNALTAGQQLAKLRLIVDTARDIWGD